MVVLTILLVLKSVPINGPFKDPFKYNAFVQRLWGIRRADPISERRILVDHELVNVDFRIRDHKGGERRLRTKMRTDNLYVIGFSQVDLNGTNERDLREIRLEKEQALLQDSTALGFGVNYPELLNRKLNYQVLFNAVHELTKSVLPQRDIIEDSLVTIYLVVAEAARFMWVFQYFNKRFWLESIKANKQYFLSEWTKSLIKNWQTLSRVSRGAPVGSKLKGMSFRLRVIARDYTLFTQNDIKAITCQQFITMKHPDGYIPPVVVDVRAEGSWGCQRRVPPERQHMQLLKESIKAKKKKFELDGYRTRIMRRPRFIQDYYSKWMNRSRPEIAVMHDVRPETFSSPTPLSINVTLMEVMALLTKQELEMTILALFVWALHSSVDTDLEPSRCAFLNPFVVNALTCQQRPMVVENHLTEVLSQPNIDNYLLPYHQGRHWSFFILCPNQLTGFILDSMSNEKTKDDYRLSSFVERLFPNFSWNFPEVQQQESGWECGYYVMHWIYDFVKFQQYSFPNFIPWNNRRPYTHPQLDAIVRFWTRAISIPND